MINSFVVLVTLSISHASSFFMSGSLHYTKVNPDLRFDSRANVAMRAYVMNIDVFLLRCFILQEFGYFVARSIQISINACQCNTS